MEEKKFGQLLELAYQAVQPHRGPIAKPMVLVIRKNKLQLVPNTDYKNEDIFIKAYTKQMLTKGLTGAQWDTLQKKLIKHQKEIKN